jgi:hypothetical protein
VLKLRATFDYRTRPFLQLALYAFEEGAADLHMQVLSQSNAFSHVTQFRVLFQDLTDPVAEARILASQFILRHGVPHVPGRAHPLNAERRRLILAQL